MKRGKTLSSYFSTQVQSHETPETEASNTHQNNPRVVPFKNQRQGVDYVMAVATKKDEEEYKSRLTIMLGVARFLLLQALAFRRHDESPSSNNRGNFLEMVKWYKEKDKKIAKLLDNAPANHLLTSPQIQKQLCKACAEETTKVIIDDIGDRKFAILVDEARDASIKEQMAVVLRYVNNKGQVIERFLGVEHVSDTTSSSLKLALDVLKGQLGAFIADVRGDLDFANCTGLGNLAVKMVQTDRHTVFPLVYRLIELALILPVATATVERAFSAMKIIKTDLRNKMNDEWMNHTMVCYIERDIFANINDDKILEHFQGMRSCKKQPSHASGSDSCPTINKEMTR